MQKFWKKNKKRLFENRQGLSLIEVLLAIAVLSITILASTAVSATYLRSRISIKKYQANNEELSVALNSMSKDIRMSNTLVENNGTGVNITVRSNVDDDVIVYTFNDTTMKLTRTEGAGVPVDILGNVIGRFYIENKAGIPRITIVIHKQGIPGMVAQTTVSMRSGYEPVP